MNVLNRKRNGNQRRKSPIIHNGVSHRPTQIVETVAIKKVRDLEAKKLRLEAEKNQISEELSDMLLEIQKVQDSDLVKLYALKERIYQGKQKYEKIKKELYRITQLVG